MTNSKHIGTVFSYIISGARPLDSTHELNQNDTYSICQRGGNQCASWGVVEFTEVLAK